MKTGATNHNRAKAIRLIMRQCEIIDRPSLETIDAKLRESKAVYDRALREGTPSDQRLALGATISRLVDLVNTFEPWHEADLASPLRDLLGAFLSLDEGAVEPLLQPAHVPHRPRRISSALIRSYGAAAAEVLMRGGWPEKVADTWVADRLKEYRRPGERGAAINGATIKGWRREVRNAAMDTMIRRRYDKWLIAPDIGEAEADAEHIIASLRRRFPVSKKAKSDPAASGPWKKP